ncbi:CHASE2 and HATPase_c domain-containing protein [Leeia sp. TBRC 13508]|uniref:histidine kinase n=1 Tax=Leeia speluncae TaxID=2884804 RepID=A0ABS8D5I4_9NEIS|nr:CHASE2 and HATPase_c domain-containing protein [Leeia speluncae]MCB6183455.1 CHASE2 and HATPase_c domain-containing protein [Leeia speluncae]
MQIAHLFSTLKTNWSRLKREWVITFLIVQWFAVAVTLGWLPFSSFDRLIYDTWLQTDRQTSSNTQIVLVEIDDKSIAQLGRWPWRRAAIAAALPTFRQADAVLLDILFSEPDNHSDALDDDALAQSIRQNGRVLLPYALQVIQNQEKWIKPIDQLADVANTLCHINVPVDTDGVVRQMSMYSLAAPPFHEHCSLALARVMHPTNEVASVPVLINLRFADDQKNYQHLSFVDVLNGTYKPAFFAHKVVIVGAKATGVGDQYAVPVGSHLMSGMEIQANALSTVMARSWIHPLSLSIVLGIQCCLISVLFLGVLLTPSKRLPLLFISFAGGVVALSWLSFQLNWWITPLPAILAVMLTYPLWSWRRLVAAIRYTEQVHQVLEKQSSQWQKPNSAETEWSEDLDVRLSYVQAVSKQLGQWQMFMLDSIQQAPDIRVITDTEGHIRLANELAITEFAALNVPMPLAGASLPHILSRYCLKDASQSPIDLSVLANESNGQETIIQTGSIWLVKASHLVGASGEAMGYSISIVDLTPIKLAEKNREETLSFLSHDMRTPQAAILALIELQNGAQPLPDDEFKRRIAKQVNQTLSLADDFVQINRLQVAEKQFVPVMLIDVLSDALDQLWPLAKQYGVRLQYPDFEEEAIVLGHREWLTRAFVNLLSNAIKYSEDDQSVSVQLIDQENTWQVQVIDHGLGMTAAQVDQLFDGFQRYHHDGSSKRTGAGLGMLFVAEVMKLHHGEISVDSQIHQGTTISVSLPKEIHSYDEPLI